MTYVHKNSLLGEVFIFLSFYIKLDFLLILVLEYLYTYTKPCFPFCQVFAKNSINQLSYPQLQSSRPLQELDFSPNRTKIFAIVQK